MALDLSLFGEIPSIAPWKLDLLGDKILSSPNLHTLLGLLPFSSLSFSEFLEKMHHDDRPYALFNIESHIHDNLPYESDFRLIHEDGTYGWIRSIGCCVRDEQGKPISMQGLFINLSRAPSTEDKIALKKKLEFLKKKLEQAREDLTTFSYLAFHSLRSPLIKTKGFVGYLEEVISSIKPLIQNRMDAFSEEEQDQLNAFFSDAFPKAIKHIVSGVDSQEKVIEAITELVTIAQKKGSVHQIDTNELLLSILRQYSDRIEKAGITVSIDKLSPIVGHRDSLEKAFSEIIKNAIIYVSDTRVPTIEIGGELHDTYVQIRIKDNGRGIPEKELPTIFQVFSRASNCLNIEGRGLGLTIARAIIIKHGGSISCRSQKEKWTVVTIELPCEFQIELETL